MDQTQITCFFQDDLAKDFQFDDDVAIDSLKECLEQLRRNKLDQPPPPSKAFNIFLFALSRSLSLSAASICLCFFWTSLPYPSPIQSIFITDFFIDVIYSLSR